MHRPEFYYTRKLLSWLFFLAGVGCLVTYFMQGMENFLLLVGSIFLFIFAYLISPHQKDKKESTEMLLDEFIIELVFYIIVFPIRILMKGLHHIFD